MLPYSQSRDQAPGYGGVEGSLNKGVWQQQRKRLNFMPIILAVLLPWGLFVSVYLIMAFSFHYAQPLFSYMLVFALLFGVLAFAGSSWFGRAKSSASGSEREPTWMLFLAASLFVAWVLGFMEGSANYSSYASPYYDLANLNDYTDVNPSQMLGQQMQDAGIVSFAAGSQLNIKKSMGFKNKDIYCVAPIVFGTAAPLSYDFWAVGKGCCSGSQADFHCDNADNPAAHGGIRLMTSDRSFYRLAVQQAEATYNIKASHPLFFTWEVNPSEEVSVWLKEAHNEFLVWIMSYLVAQLFFVAVAAAVFSKIGSEN